MTRFARAGPVNKKKANDASSWEELKGSKKNVNDKSPDSSTASQSDYLHVKQNSSKKSAHFKNVTRERFFNKGGGRMGGFARKDSRREQRRLKRAQEREASKVCFNCRGKGHYVADCPEVKEDIEQGTGICFKCGSTEHTSTSCKTKIAAGKYPYAKCFICGEKGHISKQCPDNPRGLYPLGGCCNECGSVEHLKKDCPELLKQQGIDDAKLERLSNNQSADVEPSLIDLHEKPPPKKKKQAKCVKF